METEPPFVNLRSNRKLEGVGAGDSINPGRINTDASKLPIRVRRPVKSEVPDDIAINAKLTPRPGAQTPMNSFHADQTKDSQENKLRRQTTVTALSENPKSPTSKTRNPTRGGPDNGPGGNLRHGSGSWDKPNYPIFGQVPAGPSAVDYVSPHSKALEIQARVHAYQQDTPDAWFWRDRDWLRRATTEWLRDTDKRRVFRQEREPCVACHASPSDLVDTVLEPKLGFSSSLTLQYNDLENYAWSFGHRYVVRERQDWTLHPARLPAEVEAERLLRHVRDGEQPKAHIPASVPVPEVVAAWKEGPVAITITERARGCPLIEVWDELMQGEREHYAREVGGYVAQWRRLQSTGMQGLDGGPIIKCDHLPGGDNGLPMQFTTPAQYKERLRQEMMTNKQDLRMHVEAALELMPDLEPFTLTHGYLDLDHIFVEDGRVTAIVGWSRAAYLPVWAEYLAYPAATTYYGKAPVALLMNYWDLRNHDVKGRQSADEIMGTIRRCEKRCHDVFHEGEAKARRAMEMTERRTSSAQRAKLFEEERQRALEKGAKKALDRAKRERGGKEMKAEQDAGTATARGENVDEKAKKGELLGDAEQLTTHNFFLDVEKERARAKATKEFLQRPQTLRPPEGEGEGRGGGGGGGDSGVGGEEGGGGSHRRTVSAFPSLSDRNRPLRYKPQVKNVQARRPSELESPRIRDLEKKLGFEL